VVTFDHRGHGDSDTSFAAYDDPGAASDVIEFELATGRKGFVLERELLNATEIPLSNLMNIFPTGGTAAAGTLADIQSPELAGNHVSARKVQEMEIEGTDLIDTVTSGRALSGATAVGVPLTTLAGKIALLTDATTQELYGYLRGQLAPEGTGAFRILVEVIA